MQSLVLAGLWSVKRCAWTLKPRQGCHALHDRAMLHCAGLQLATSCKQLRNDNSGWVQLMYMRECIQVVHPCMLLHQMQHYNAPACLASNSEDFGSRDIFSPDNLIADNPDSAFASLVSRIFAKCAASCVLVISVMGPMSPFLADAWCAVCKVHNISPDKTALAAWHTL